MRKAVTADGLSQTASNIMDHLKMARRTVKVFSRALQVDGASQCGTWTTWSALLNLHPESEPVLLFTTTNKNNAIGEIDPAAAEKHLCVIWRLLEEFSVL